jgi:prefoldin subunit 5
MWRSVFFSAAALAALGAVSASEVTPIVKVIELLEGMLNKGKEEKHAEQVQFAAYKQFCDDTSVAKKRAIEEAEERIGMLKATIEKSTQDAAQLAREIAEHESDIAAWTGDKKAATKERDLSKADYQELHKDYSESVDALQRAVAYLKDKSRTMPQASLAQTKVLREIRDMTLIPAAAKKTLDAFLQASQDPDAALEVTAPEAYAYESRLGPVIEMLEKLLDKFIDERTALEKEEMNSKHAYEMLMQDLEAQLTQAESDVNEKSVFKAKKLQEKANAEGDLEDTSTTKADDESYLADLTSTCEQKSSDFEIRQQLRAEEIVAISKAIEVCKENAHLLDSRSSAALITKAKPAKATSLASLRSDTRSPAQARAAKFLQERAGRLNSRMLSVLAARVSDDPFAKVKKMIKDLIVRLMEEANEEAEHKGWCDSELATNEVTRKEKTAAVETLHAEIDELEASIAKLTEEIGELTEAIAQLDAAMAEATGLRTEEKKSNEATIKDAVDAQAAVAQALAVLRDFYSKQAEATLVQTKRQQPKAPEIFNEPYRGMTGEASGVIGMLEVIESDFARLEAETTASEAAAQKEYDEFMTDSKVDKAAKTKDVEHKTAKKQDSEHALTMKTNDLDGTQKELDAALRYFDKLKPSCVDSGVSHEERVQRRQEEIESLQEALRILNGEEIA